MHALSQGARACVLVVLTVIVPVGCGPSTAVPESHEEFTISQVAQIFQMRHRAQKPAPKGIKDVEDRQAAVPAAVAAIKSGDVKVYWGVEIDDGSGDVIVYWGTGLADGSEAASTVLAYQKDVPEKGGEVLMQDGNTRKMTAEEFKAAKKPAGGKLEDSNAAGKN
jgi:hypothetical protein